MEITVETVLKAHDQVRDFVRARTTPEALAQAEKMRMEMIALLDGLNERYRQVESVLADRFPGQDSMVPVWTRPGIVGQPDRLWFMFFDGKSLWGMNNKGQDRSPITSRSIEFRIGAVHALPALISALTARMWIS